MFTKVRIFLILVGFLFNSVAYAMTAKEMKQYPMGITPTEVYRSAVELNAYVHVLLVKEKLSEWQQLPKVERTIRPSVVFQLAIAIVEMMHDYELKQGLRPIPVITSSPIHYYPADVEYVVKLLIARFKEITRAQKIFHVSIPKPREGRRTPYDVYEQLLRFYMRLAALNGITDISASENFTQMHRAQEEMKSIVVKSAETIQSAMKRRLLVSSMIGVHPTGPKLGTAIAEASSQDVYKECLDIRKLMNGILKQHDMNPIPVPLFNKEQKFTAVDVFIQSQIILTELSELKRILGVADSSPVTKSTSGKSSQDVLQEAMSLSYMLQRYRDVLHD